MPLLLIFILVPIIEIGLFIQVGGFIGLWPTLGIVVLTAVLGSWMLRAQGTAELEKLRQNFSNLSDPTEPLAHGAMILFAGALLLTPGFFTDAVGFLLLVPGFRKVAMNYLKRRMNFVQFSAGHGRPGHNHYPKDGDIIDGEFSEVPPDRDALGNPPRNRH